MRLIILGNIKKQERYSQRNGSPRPNKDEERYSMPVQNRDDFLNSAPIDSGSNDGSLFDAAKNKQFTKPGDQSFKKSGTPSAKNQSDIKLNNQNGQISRSSNTNNRYEQDEEGEDKTIQNNLQNISNKDSNSGMKNGSRTQNMNNIPHITTLIEQSDNGRNIYDSEEMLPNLASTDFQNEIQSNNINMTRYKSPDSQNIATGPALGYSSEFPSKELRKKYKKHVKAKELHINRLIKRLLREELIAAIDKFVVRFDIRCANEESIKKSLFELILSKCKGVFTMLFFQNKAKFFKLLRKNPEQERELVGLWDELVGMYGYFKANDVDSEPVLRQFVRRALSFPTLQNEMAFLLRYMFKVFMIRYILYFAYYSHNILVDFGWHKFHIRWEI